MNRRGFFAAIAAAFAVKPAVAVISPVWAKFFKEIESRSRPVLTYNRQLSLEEIRERYKRYERITSHPISFTFVYPPAGDKVSS